MSIINVFITPESALVGVDTEAQTLDGGYLELTKTIYLPHIQTVVAYRGVAITLGLLMPMVMNFDGGFDELAEAMPALVAESIRTILSAGVNKHDVETADLILVGYSPKAARMVGHLFASKPGRPIETVLDFPQFYAPYFGVEAIKRLGIDADRSGMLDLAMDQCRRSRESAIKGATAGGRFFITELTKDRISVEQAGRFPSRSL